MWMNAAQSPVQLPYELNEKILTLVLLDSIHDMCFPRFSEERPIWKLHAFGILSSVCQTFQEICCDISVRAFRIKDGERPIPIVTAKFYHLYYHYTARSGDLKTREWPFEKEPLNIAYRIDVLYMYHAFRSIFLMRKRFGQPDVPMKTYDLKIYARLSDLANGFQRICARMMNESGGGGGGMYIYLEEIAQQQSLLIDLAVPVAAGMRSLLSEMMLSQFVFLMLAHLEDPETCEVVKDYWDTTDSAALTQALDSHRKLSNSVSREVLLPCTVNYSAMTRVSEQWTGSDVPLHQLPEILSSLREVTQLSYVAEVGFFLRNARIDELTSLSITTAEKTISNFTAIVKMCELCVESQEQSVPGSGCEILKEFIAEYASLNDMKVGVVEKS
ncbi:hypothetical protein D9758_006154 [Tetrapyrgos nigripes]|uniref:Uncharacterized protein n=1 Tax=Tetrapyrgos nigripes TaxID=182062 RepID=A0A8H5GAR7_9AGAR|nr:hypothetical protein D9758_006154 [Tetrapyrgos nigripes]